MIVGERIPEIRRRIDLPTLVRYAGASGDFNRIHYDEAYAREAGLDGIIGHGLLALALVGEAVTDWVGDPGVVRSLDGRFTQSYRLGDVLTVSGEVQRLEDGLAHVALRCTNQDGMEIIGKAGATVLAGERSLDG